MTISRKWGLRAGGEGGGVLINLIAMKAYDLKDLSLSLS